MHPKILLVEGKSDRDFFSELCQHIVLDVEVRVSTPKEHGARRDGKLSAIDLLPGLMKQLADGSITHLAMVVDADHASQSGLGYARTLERIAQKIAEFGYNPIPNHADQGLVFSHSDGLHDFGLWIMPDNASEGMLEDWIRQTIHSAELPLFEHASKTVQALSTPKFKSIHYSKAEIATWLAWQKKPGQGLYAVISDELIDMKSQPVKHMVDWLQRIYGSTHEV